MFETPPRICGLEANNATCVWERWFAWIPYEFYFSKFGAKIHTRLLEPHTVRQQCFLLKKTRWKTNPNGGATKW